MDLSSGGQAPMPEPGRLCVIPARGGSKRVPRKNIRLLGGRPLIAYTIDAALQSGVFESVVVSTEDDEIAKVSVHLGAQVPFRRSAVMADDETPVSVVIIDALHHLDPDASRFSSVAQMMPNCPFRTAEDVRASLAHFEATCACLQISVAPFGWANPWWALRQNETGDLKPLFPEALISRSQDLPELFAPTGAIWWARPDVLRAHGSFHAPERKCYSLSWLSGFDIDTEEDLRIADRLRPLATRETGGGGCS